MIFMALGSQLFIWVHVDTFLVHTFLLFHNLSPQCFPSFLLHLPFFQVEATTGQYRNLWKAARHDTDLVEVSPHPAVQQVRVFRGTIKQAPQLGSRMTRGPEAFLTAEMLPKLWPDTHMDAQWFRQRKLGKTVRRGEGRVLKELNSCLRLPS